MVCGFDSEEQWVVRILIARDTIFLLFLQTTETADPLCSSAVFFCPGPGLNLAQSSLWLACAMSLAVFDIGKYVDGFGNVVEPKIHYSDGAIR